MSIRPLNPTKKERKPEEKPKRVDLNGDVGVNTLTPPPLEPIPSYDGFIAKPAAQGAVMGTNDQLRMPGDLNDPNAAYGTPAPAKAPPPLSEIEQLEAAKKALIEKGQEKVGVGSKLLYSLFEGMQTFANPGRGPIQPLENVRFQNSMDNIDRRLTPLYAMRDKEVQYKKSQIEQQIAGANAFKAQNEAVRSANPYMYDSLMRDQVITDEESEQASAAGLGYIAPGDYREFKDREHNGAIIATPTIGVPNWQTTNAPIDPAKRETGLLTQLPNGGPTVYTTGNKELDRANAVKTANIVNLGKVADTNRGIQTKEAESLYEYETKKRETKATSDRLRADGNALMTKADQLDAQAAQLEQSLAARPASRFEDPSERRNTENQIRDLKAKALESRTQGTLKINESDAVLKSLPTAPPALPKAQVNPIPENKVFLDPKTIVVDSEWIDNIVKESKKTKNPKTREQAIQELTKLGYTVKP